MRQSSNGSFAFLSPVIIRMGKQAHSRFAAGEDSLAPVDQGAVIKSLRMGRICLLRFLPAQLRPFFHAQLHVADRLIV